ncbi:MAG: hypothetical protein SGARI_005260, partial [Bacillariaceae sp.]
CAPLQAAAAAALQRPLDLFSLASLTNVGPTLPQVAAGNSILSAYAMLPRESVPRDSLLTQLYGATTSAVAAAPPSVATTAPTSVGESLQGTSVPSMSSLDDSFAALVNTLAAAKADEAIRQASSAALRLPTAPPTEIDSQLQSGLNQAELARVLAQSQQATSTADRGLVVDSQISLVRALALSSRPQSPSARTQSPNSASVLEALLNRDATN